MARRERSIYEGHPMASRPVAHIKMALADAVAARDHFDKQVRELEPHMTGTRGHSNMHASAEKYADQVHDYAGILRDIQRGLLPEVSEYEWNRSSMQPSGEPEETSEKSFSKSATYRSPQKNTPFPFSFYPGEARNPNR